MIGHGVYVTDLKPNEGKYAISMNNWDSDLPMREGKTDHAIRLSVPDHLVQFHRVGGYNGSRTVGLIRLRPGETLDLDRNGIHARFITVP